MVNNSDNTKNDFVKYLILKCDAVSIFGLNVVFDSTEKLLSSPSPKWVGMTLFIQASQINL